MRHRDLEALFKDYKPPTPLKAVTPSSNKGDDRSNISESSEDESEGIKDAIHDQ